eukprot:scaffold118936_cov28-Tisochrysis_lutea.AAC.4
MYSLSAVRDLNLVRRLQRSLSCRFAETISFAQGPLGRQDLLEAKSTKKALWNTKRLVLCGSMKVGGRDGE